MDFQPTDVVRVDDEWYYIKAVTDTLLVRLLFRDDMGRAEFDRIVENGSFVSVHRCNASVRKVSEEEFTAEINKFVAENPSFGAFLTLPVEADKYYLTKNHSAGYAISDDELVGLFNHTGPSGLGESLVIHSISRGARRLFCYDTELVSLYQKFGFTESDRAPWNDDLASDDWDYETYGKPDVVWMEL